MVALRVGSREEQMVGRKIEGIGLAGDRARHCCIRTAASTYQRPD
jgi:hypothetical protein